MPPAKNDTKADRAVVAGTAEPTTGALSTAQDVARQVQADIGARMEDLTKALAGRMDPNWFTSAVVSTFRRSPGLWSVVKTPQGRASMMASVIEAAQIGLPFLMGRAYLVPFQNHGVDEAQLIVGYQGLVDKVTAPGTGVTYVEAAVVYAKDEFSFQRGTGGYLRHREAISDDGSTVDRGPRRAVWVRVVFASGQDRWDVWDMARVEAIRKRSKAANARTSPWVTDYDEMAKKSLLRNICKTLRIDFQLMQLLDKEDAWEGQPSVAAPADQQSSLRRQLQAHYTDDTQPAEDGEQPPTPPAAAPAASDGDSGADADPLWQPMDVATSAETPATCGHQLAGHSCTLAVGHKGGHSDGSHDWPA